MNRNVKKLIVFDLDGTLAESKSAIDPEMGGLLSGLLGVAQVAIISGGDYPQFQTQVLAHLPAGERFDRLALLPTCGTKYYEYRNGAWTQRYAENFTDAEKARIIKALDDAIAETGIGVAKTWGPAVEDRGSQITYSALGQQAPLDAKKTWDPDFAKRKRAQAILAKTLPDFSVALGGSTSIDVTKPGIDKAYGMYKLRDILGLTIGDMLFIGDALFPGGNDEPARSTGATCIMTRDVEETKRLIETIIACA
jgi:HAD superfamily hydrolase (TIGR01484 family)